LRLGNGWRAGKKKKNRLVDKGKESGRAQCRVLKKTGHKLVIWGEGGRVRKAREWPQARYIQAGPITPGKGEKEPIGSFERGRKERKAGASKLRISEKLRSRDSHERAQRGKEAKPAPNLISSKKESS